MFKSYLHYQLCVIVSLSLLPLSAFSASPEELASEEEIFGDIPVSFTATRLSQSVHDSPVSITIIDQDMIEAYDPHELIDVLRLVPGFQVIHAKGFRSSASYHGLGDEFSSRMQVQIDGRSVYSPILGHVEWAELPIEVEDIERIEVIRGPNAASYGANSFTAIVNIITHHASDTPGTYIKLKNGDRNTKRYLARHGGNAGRLDYRLTASYHSDSGFDVERFPDDKTIKSFNFRGDYQPNINNRFEFQVGYRDTLHQDGDNDDLQVTPLRNAKGRTHFQLLRWRHQLDEKENFSLQFYHNYQRIDDVYQTAPIDDLVLPGFAAFVGADNLPVTVEDSRLLHRYDLEFQHNRQFDDTFQLVWGASARYEQTGAAGFFDTTSTHDFIDNHTYRLFAHGEWKPNPEWTLNAGAMIEKNDISGTDISPRLALNYHFTPNHTVRASASRAYRTPSVLEVNADRIARIFDTDGNPIDLDQIILSDRKLKPEKLTSLELAYIGHFPGYGINIDAKLFYDRVENIINDVADFAYSDPISILLNPAFPSLFPLASDRVNNPDNTGDATLKGFEAQLQYQLSADTRAHAGYTVMNIDGKILNQVNSGAPGQSAFLDLKESVPRTISTLQVIHDFKPGLSASFAFHHYSDYDFKDSDPVEAFSILNARIAKKFRFNNGEGKISGSFQNLLGDYFDYNEEQVFENRLFVSFEYGFD